MRTTITTEMDLGDGIRIEVDGDYWRGEDEYVTDLTLFRLWVYEPQGHNKARGHDLLHGLDRQALDFNTRLEHRFKTFKFTMDEPGRKHVLEQITQRRIKQAHPVMQTALAEATENNC